MKYLYLFVLIPVLLFGKNLYVNSATGNDATTYANNNSENPWATIGRAAWGSTTRSSPNSSEAAQAGDSVIIAAGTYNASANSNVRYVEAYFPANSGSSGNPIVFYGNGTVILQSTNDDGPVIGCTTGRSYITWDNFTLDVDDIGMSTTLTGPVVLFGGSNGSMKNIRVIGFGYAPWGDNCVGIYVQDHDNAYVANCEIDGFYCYDVNPHNGAGIMVYNSWDFVFENNTIYNCGSGINLKAMYQTSRGGATVRYNYIYSTSQSGITCNRVSSGTNPEIYQNLIKDCGAGVKFWGFDTGDPNQVYYVNNTIYNCTNGITYQYTPNTLDGKVYNNLIVNCDVGNWRDEEAAGDIDTSWVQFQHNDYYNNTVQHAIDGTDYTLAQWQSSFAPQDSASLAVDPVFVNAIADSFQLQASSPCTTGVDLLDLDGDLSTTDAIKMGCYITGNETIGVGGVPAGNPQAGGNFSTKTSDVLIIR